MALAMPKTELSMQSRIATIGKLNYLEFFGLATPPFRNTADVLELFLTPGLNAAYEQIDRHLEARAGGLLLVTGAPGSGKTTLVSQLLDHRADPPIIAKINRTLLAQDDFVQMLLHAFGLRAESLNQADSGKQLSDFLKAKHQAGHYLVLLIDEAQNLKPDVLAFLSRLFTQDPALSEVLLIILVGQDSTRDALNLAAARGLREQLQYEARLETLSEPETIAYVEHQLRAAGLRHENPFTEPAMVRIHQLTGGSMRRINTLCDFVLFNACLGRIAGIDPQLVQTTFNALQWEPTQSVARAAPAPLRQPHPPVPEPRWQPSPPPPSLPPQEPQRQPPPQALQHPAPSAPDSPAARALRARLTPKRQDQRRYRLRLDYDAGQELALDRPSICIGRSTQNDICIRDLRVSRFHARLTASSKGYSIEDLGSTNGVYVNSERIKVRLLKPGDTIVIDANPLTYLEDDASDGD